MVKQSQVHLLPLLLLTLRKQQVARRKKIKASSLVIQKQNKQSLDMPHWSYYYPWLRKQLTYFKRLAGGMTEKGDLKDTWQVALLSKELKAFKIYWNIFLFAYWKSCNLEIVGWRLSYLINLQQYQLRKKVDCWLWLVNSWSKVLWVFMIPKHLGKKWKFSQMCVDFYVTSNIWLFENFWALGIMWMF